MFEQLNMFAMVDTESTLPLERQEFRKQLRKGSNFAGGRERIKQAAMQLSKADFVAFLKKEFGIGGWFGSNIGHVSFDGKGYVMNAFQENEKKYTWVQVADEILDLLATNSY